MWCVSSLPTIFDYYTHYSYYPANGGCTQFLHWKYITQPFNDGVDSMIEFRDFKSAKYRLHYGAYYVQCEHMDMDINEN